MAHLADSGERREFTTGAVRDIAEGKGRCDLLPLEAIGVVYSDDFLDLIDHGIHRDPSYIRDAAGVFTKRYFKDEYTALLELAVHYEDGCKKYGERNWEKGIPVHCFLDSAIRHYLKLRRGDKDERHDRAVLWNLYGAIWTILNHPELNDLLYKTEDKNVHPERTESTFPVGVRVE